MLNVNKQVTVFNRTVLNVLKSNFHYTIPLNYIFDDKYPLWFNKKIIQKIYHRLKLSARMESMLK